MTEQNTPPADDDVREALAFHLFAEESIQEEEAIRRVWANRPDEHPVKLLYFDQADALLAAFEVTPRGTAPAPQISDAEVERAAILADLREWSRPLGYSPTEEALALVIARIEDRKGI